VAYTVSSPGRIRVSIKDTGAGLPPEKLAQLFQPFNRLGQEAGTEEGTGIGLVVAKKLTELMGGVIGVESSVGKGSVFWFELMAAAKPQFGVESGKPKAHAQSDVRSRARVRTVLYVEDNPANMKLVEQIIARRPDLRLLSATTGTLGIELAHANQPDVILMDINLPDISGIDALRLLRKDPATEHIPLVAISANAMPHDIEKGLQAGFFRYLTKPIKVDEFMVALNAALELQLTRSKLSQEALTVLPGALVKLLREAALAADLDRIMKLTQQVEAYDRDIASELRVLASRFAYQRLLDLLISAKDAS